MDHHRADDARQAALDKLRPVDDSSDQLGINLAEAALILGSLDRPRVPLDRYRDHLARLATDVAELADDSGGAEARADALRSVIADRFGYAGDRLNHDDLQNANLLRVIDRRRGLPVALAILFLHAARANGWTADGLTFPGHVLVRLEAGGNRIIIDPFAGGGLQTVPDLRALLKSIEGPSAELRADCYEIATNIEILLRLQNNIKRRLIRDHRLERALDCVEVMLAMAPGHATLWRDAGLLHARLGQRDAAVSALETFIQRETSAVARHHATALLQRLRHGDM